MDQFPHDNCPKDKDQPERKAPRRDVHATAKFQSGLPMVKVFWSPVKRDSHDILDVTQALALMNELAIAVHSIDQTAASLELATHIHEALKDWGVKDDD